MQWTLSLDEFCIQLDRRDISKIVFSTQRVEVHTAIYLTSKLLDHHVLYRPCLMMMKFNKQHTIFIIPHKVTPRNPFLAHISLADHVHRGFSMGKANTSARRGGGSATERWSGKCYLNLRLRFLVIGSVGLVV